MARIALKSAFWHIAQLLIIPTIIVKWYLCIGAREKERGGRARRRTKNGGFWLVRNHVTWRASIIPAVLALALVAGCLFLNTFFSAATTVGEGVVGGAEEGAFPIRESRRSDNYRARSSRAFLIFCFLWPNTCSQRNGQSFYVFRVGAPISLFRIDFSDVSTWRIGGDSDAGLCLGVTFFVCLYFSQSPFGYLSRCYSFFTHIL